MIISRPDTFSPSDRQAILDILKKVGWSEAQIIGQVGSIGHFLQDQDAAVFFAREGSQAAGYATCQLYRWNRLGQIHGLVVDPAFRRRGMAAGLVAACEGFLRENSARGVYVDTPVDNLGGRQFYEAIGYRLGYIMPQYYDVGQDGVTYQKFF